MTEAQTSLPPLAGGGTCQRADGRLGGEAVAATMADFAGQALSDHDLAVEASSRNPRWGVKPASFVVDEVLVHHVAKHQGQIRRNIAQFNEARPTA